MLSDDEITRQIKEVRHSSRTDRNASRILSINHIAQATGLSREIIYQVARGAKLTGRVRQKLAEFLACQENERVRSTVSSTSGVGSTAGSTGS